MFSPSVWIASVTTASTVSPSISLRAQRIKISRSVLKNRLRDLLRIGTELLVHTDEVGLAVELNECACMRIVGNERNDRAFVRSATSLLSDRSKTCRTQNVDSLIHVAHQLRRVPSCIPSCLHRSFRGVLLP